VYELWQQSIIHVQHITFFTLQPLDCRLLASSLQPIPLCRTCMRSLTTSTGVNSKPPVSCAHTPTHMSPARPQPPAASIEHLISFIGKAHIAIALLCKLGHASGDGTCTQLGVQLHIKLRNICHKSTSAPCRTRYQCLPQLVSTKVCSVGRNVSYLFTIARNDN
jgi:hypothetical protein